MMDENKIIIINLSKGRVGEANANLLGSMLITKIYLAAMSRADVSDKVLQTLPNFYLYVDEFQSFANESFADILSEARKYKLNLTIAHQYIEQMSEEVRAAVFGNVGTMVTFRVGAFDAEILEKEFAPQFTAEDLVNLGFAQIYLKLMINGVSSAPFSAVTMPPIKEPERSYRNEVVEMSRTQFAMNRAGVEQEVLDWHKDKGQGPKPVLDHSAHDKKEVINPPVQAVVVKESRTEVVEKKVPPPVARTFDRPKYMKREEVRPPAPKPELWHDDDFMSLQDLKGKIPDNPIVMKKAEVSSSSLNAKKTMDPKSLSELRSVLQSLNKNKIEDKAPAPPPVPNNKPKEIPEAELRQMLQVDSTPSQINNLTDK